MNNHGIAPSTRKCGVGDEAITHAFNNPIRTVDLTTTSSCSSAPTTPGIAMAARPKFLE